MRILAVVNQKGGVGKSTLAVHLAYMALEKNLRVLLVDLDRQGSLSLSFPGRGDGLAASALFREGGIEEAPEDLGGGLAIIRADDTLSLLHGASSGAERRPAAHLRRLADQYDLCVIDTPGAIGFNPPMTVAALIAADAVVCPFSVGLYESKGLADLWAYLKSIRSGAYNPRLRLLGLLPSKVNTKSREECDALADLRKRFGSVILPGTLAERVAVKQAIMRHRPVWKGTKGAGHLAAAREWYGVCDQILGSLAEVRK